MNSIIEYVMKNFVFQKDPNLDYIVYSGSRGEKGFITLIFYSNGRPVVVVKVSRDTMGYGIKKEYNALKSLQKMLNNSDLIKTIEFPLHFNTFDGNLVLLKEYKNGISGDRYISSSFTKRKKIERSTIFLRASTDWLIQFLNETKEYHTTSMGKKIKAVYKLVPGENLPSYLEYWAKGDKFFLAPSHGDLVPSNILIKSSKVCGIIDFENFTLEGFPLADLIGIIVSTGTTLYGTNQEMINETFFNPSPFSRAACMYISKFCETFELDIKDFIRLMPMYSDRAISLCARWDMNVLNNFHINLKSDLIKRQNELILRDYI